jgi:hypothetical protein
MRRMHIRMTLPWGVAVLQLAACAPGNPWLRAGPEPQRSFLSADVGFLAADALEGRATGTAGNDSARAWIVQRMQRLGLEPLFNPPCPSCARSFVQPFDARMSGAERNGLPASLPTGNVGGLIRGRDPALRGEYVVLGAHFDHLGRRPFGSRDSPHTGAIHNGADDNASGVAAVLELARLLRKNPPRRSVVVLAFSAEELGLLGSDYLVNHAPFALDSVQAMLNFDMVGRLRDDRLMVFGTATAREFPALLEGENREPAFRLNAVGDGNGRSDHASFYQRSVPVLHFFTDVHDDYHRSTDDAERIDVAGMERVIAYAERVTRSLADRASRLTFVRAPVAAPAASPSRSGVQPSLGTVPDMGAGDVPGLRLSGVTPGGAADRAGLKSGDVVVELGGKPVSDLQTYSDALYSHKPGDEVTVVVLRGAQRLTVTVTLGRRGG